jgi:transposase
MKAASTDTVGLRLFNDINKKLAEIEAQLCAQNIEKNKFDQEKARLDESLFRFRQLKKEQDQLNYEKRKLELEQESFVEAKKQAIIEKAKERGYSVQERIENGVVKLKLIKRMY